MFERTFQLRKSVLVASPVFRRSLRHKTSRVARKKRSLKDINCEAKHCLRTVAEASRLSHIFVYKRTKGFVNSKQRVVFPASDRQSERRT